MALRKINAILSLLTTLLFLNHAFAHAVWMLTGGRFVVQPNISPWILFGLMMVHAILSIVLAVLGHKGAEKRKCNGYPNLNRATYLQRASGVSLILLTVLHILGTAGPLRPPVLIHAILPPLFFTVCFIHVVISTGKAFVTLGVGNMKLLKVADLLIKVLCVSIWLADVVGFYLYLA